MLILNDREGADQCLFQIHLQYNQSSIRKICQYQHVHYIHLLVICSDQLIFSVRIDRFLSQYTH